MKIKLNAGVEFNITGIVDTFGILEITFAEGTTYADVAEIYDPISELFDKETLRRMEIYNDEDQIQGTHLGYTETEDISSLNGIVRVKIKKEDTLKTEIELLKTQSVTMNGAISELSTIISMGGMQL